MTKCNRYKKNMIVAICFLFSCNSKNKEISINETGFFINELEHKVKNNGNKIAYKLLATEYLDNNRESDLLPFSIYMVNEFNNYEFCYDVFLGYYLKQNLINDNKYSLDKLNNNDLDSAIFYLKKGADLKDFQCMKRLGEYYLEGKYVIKNLEEGKRLISSAKLK